MSSGGPKKGGRIVIAGGSGFLGSALSSHFQAAGAEVVVLTRGPSRTAGQSGRFVHWDAQHEGHWVETLRGARALINLTGKRIDCRPTSANRAEIRRSRIDAVKVLGAAVRQAQPPPAVFVQASAVGYYGDRDDLCRESDPPGTGFLPETCMLWENAFHELTFESTRQVVLRIGVVLGAGGGALPILVRLTRAFLGGAAGHGRQGVSWIAVRDFCRVVDEVIDNAASEGCYHATAPEPVPNAGLMQALRRHFGRPWSPPVPAPAIRLGAWLAGTNPDLVLSGQRAEPTRLLDQGFEFEHPVLKGALAEAYEGV